MWTLKISILGTILEQMYDLQGLTILQYLFLMIVQTLNWTNIFHHLAIYSLKSVKIQMKTAPAQKIIQNTD